MSAAPVDHRESTAAAAVLADLDPEQRAAAMATRGPVCIVAGAGTGKTRAITHRIAYAVHSGAVPSGQLLAVTFTARAADELRTRLRRLGVSGVQGRTFHAAALRQLRYFAPRVLGGQLPRVTENPLRLVSMAAARARLRVERSEIRDLAAEINWAKAVLVGPDDYAARSVAAGREPPRPPASVAEVYAEYEQAKQRAGELDFSDLLLIMAGAIEEYGDVAEEVRSRYRHFVVDEYQDVSPLQQRLLEAWLGERDDLCVVGDPNQTIYSFAGATPRYLEQFGKRYPSAVTVRLIRDYRSTPQVVELANRLVRSAARSGVVLVGQRPDGPRPNFAEYDDEPAEAAAVAAQCKSLIASGLPAADIAVLFRVNAQSEVYEQALAEVGVPYLVRGGERFFDRPEIREARLLLRGAARAEAGAESLADAVRAVLAGMGWHSDSVPPGGTARERWESLAALVSLADDVLAASPAAYLPEFVAELDRRAAAQHAPTVQGVTLASLHSAKGLEWDAVFLVGLVEGTVPIQHADTDEQLAEERRLLYVGITRARERVALSWALARSPGQRRGRRPSRFLDAVRPPSEPRTSPRKKKKSVVPEASDAELFGRLRTWRRRQAEAQQVPAYVVFSDATLVAIADANPSSRAELAKVAGVGPAKLTRYGESVLSVLSGADPEQLPVG